MYKGILTCYVLDDVFQAIFNLTSDSSGSFCNCEIIFDIKQEIHSIINKFYTQIIIKSINGRPINDLETNVISCPNSHKSLVNDDLIFSFSMHDTTFSISNISRIN